MTKTRLALIAVLLLLAPFGAAQEFSSTNPSQTPDRFNLAYDDTNKTQVTTIRGFSVNESAQVFAFLASEPPAGYSVDMQFSNDTGATWTTVASGETTTEPSQEVTIDSTGHMRAIVHFPGTRDTGTVDVDIVVAINATTDQGGNGGTLQPSFNHKVRLYFYDAQSDTDVDGLPDAWEQQYFGTLDYVASDDPDGDGYSNAEEYEAGTDPSNEDSKPASTVIGGGGGNVDDREIGAFATGLVLFALTAFGVFLGLRRNKEGAVAKVLLPAGIGILAGFVVLAFLDYVVLDHAGFAFWAYLGASWQEWTVFMLAVASVLMVAAVAFLKINSEAKERQVAFYTGLTVIGVGVAAYLLFWQFEVPLPF